MTDRAHPDPDGAAGGAPGAPGAGKDPPDALTVAYRHLGRREHSVAQLRARLGRAGCEPAAAEDAIATLAGEGVLDDARYARLLAEDRRALDGWGAERIRARLEADGIEVAQIDAALAAFDGASELEAATALARRRHPAPLQTDAERQRIFAMLVRRGYDSDIAYAAVRAAGRAPR